MNKPISVSATIVDAIRDKKGSRIAILDLTEIGTAGVREFIICQGNSTTQVGAIADNIKEEVTKHLGRKPLHAEGFRNSQWVILDYGETMVHIFLPEARERYNLEDLWGDANMTRLEDIY